MCYISSLWMKYMNIWIPLIPIICSDIKCIICSWLGLLLRTAVVLHYGTLWHTVAQYVQCAPYSTFPQFSSWKHTSAFCSVELAAIKAALPSSVYCLYFFYLYFLYCQLKLAVYTSYLLGDNGIVQRQNRPFEWYELYIIYMISFVSSELCILWHVFDIP